MGTISAYKQKLKGKVQKIKANHDLSYGHTVRGGITKIKGDINQISADAKLKKNSQKRKRAGY